ncbi:DUF2269 family protein [Amycolatopsis anabasis]|uniref:DUF2269 family protein n=1 Tax=Amycolatopsis anabasis TaxID=1840409 RepID=UPI00131C2201|nr:DUF2269 family protein [Amycolatopsis anabasis]
MTKVLLSIHILAGILFVGPPTVTASLFPRYARLAGERSERDLAAARVLNRITRVYAVLSVAVPVFGLATAIQMKILTQAWLLVSIVLTAAAAGVLAFLVLPQQTRILASLTGPEPGTEPHPLLGKAAMSSGIFALLWTVVVVLMVLRPGSTTGA